MTPDEEGEWAQTLGPVPTKGHAYYVLHESGLLWTEIEACFDVSDVHGAVTWHDKDKCRWCQR